MRIFPYLCGVIRRVKSTTRNGLEIEEVAHDTDEVQEKMTKKEKKMFTCNMLSITEVLNDFLQHENIPSHVYSHLDRLKRFAYEQGVKQEILEFLVFD